MKTPLPPLKTDEEAAEFVENADLSGFDLTAFKRVEFEFAPKSKSLTMRLPDALLSAVKSAAAARGMPYQRFIRLALEREIAVMTDKRSAS